MGKVPDPMPGIAIRPFLPNEWRRYRDLRLRALQDSPDAFGSTFETSSLIPDSEWKARLERVSPRTDLPMGAMAGGEPVGLAWAKIENPDDGVAHLYQMWVAPEFRGAGVGRGLVDAAVNWARDRGVKAMVLDVTCGNVPATRLYESMGFQPVGTPVPLRPGSDLLEQTMELRFSDACN